MSTGRDAAITAYEEVAGLLSVLRSAAQADPPPSMHSVLTIAELSLQRANLIGGFLADLPHD